MAIVQIITIVLAIRLAVTSWRTRKWNEKVEEEEREARKEWLSLMNDRDGTTELVDRQR